MAFRIIIDYGTLWRWALIRKHLLHNEGEKLRPLGGSQGIIASSEDDQNV
jgi:hypothetical protein